MAEATIDFKSSARLWIGILQISCRTIHPIADLLTSTDEIVMITHDRSRCRRSGSAADRCVSIEVDGGQITIGKVIVRTDYREVFKDNRQYLAFTKLQQYAPAGPNTVLNPILIEDGTFVSRSPDENERKLHGLRLADVLRDIRRAMN